jgi:hypothetical protein
MTLFVVMSTKHAPIVHFLVVLKFQAPKRAQERDHLRLLRALDVDEKDTWGSFYSALRLDGTLCPLPQITNNKSDADGIFCPSQLNHTSFIAHFGTREQTIKI